jgi:ribosomal protein S18 acetylase RimI-like enzyme
MISLRSVTPQDNEFLYRVYASTRQEELAQVDWDTAHKEAFLRMQFAAQAKYYAENYDGAQFQIVLLNDTPVGRLYVARWAKGIRIIDIALLPEYRGRGIGSTLLNEILAEGQTRGLPVTIHVERFNPARRLYDRLGFRVAEDKGVYYLLEWTLRAG